MGVPKPILERVQTMLERLRLVYGMHQPVCGWCLVGAPGLQVGGWALLGLGAEGTKATTGRLSCSLGGSSLAD